MQQRHSSFIIPNPYLCCMKKNIRTTVIIFLFCHITRFLLAQFHSPVLPTLSGQVLLDELQNQYKPNTVLSFGNARDTLFAKIYLVNDSLEAVYTGHRIYLPPNEDPTQAAYQNGAATGINTEHTYPQTFGASSGNAKSDMHHLYPTRISVNEARGSLPFGEITDSETIQWFYLLQTLSNTPTQNIDAYSELGNGRFESRESHKGNVARAMFYFYTMYREQADAANPDYFELQKETLCDWHLLDPVDQEEWRRNFLIADYQSGKANPFILDCTLAERSYCADFNQSCMPSTSVNEVSEATPFVLYQNSPNPFFQSTMISYRITQEGQVRLSLFDTQGRLCKIIVDENQSAGLYHVDLGESVFTKEMLYFYKLEWFDSGSHYQKTRKLLKL